MTEWMNEFINRIMKFNGWWMIKSLIDNKLQMNIIKKQIDCRGQYLQDNHPPPLKMQLLHNRPIVQNMCEAAQCDLKNSKFDSELSKIIQNLSH